MLIGAAASRIRGLQPVTRGHPLSAPGSDLCSRRLGAARPASGRTRVR